MNQICTKQHIPALLLGLAAALAFIDHSCLLVQFPLSNLGRLSLNSTYIGVRIFPSDLVLLLALGSSGIINKIQGHRHTSKHTLLLWGLLILIPSISTFWSVAPINSLWQAFRFSVYTGVGFFILVDVNKLKAFSLPLFISGVFYLLFIPYLYKTTYFMGPIANRSVMGGFIVVCGFLALYLYIRTQWWAYLTIAALVPAITLLTSCRAAILASCILICLIAWTNFKITKSLRKPLLTTAITISLMILALNVIPPPSSKHIFQGINLQSIVSPPTSTQVNSTTGHSTKVKPLLDIHKMSSHRLDEYTELIETVIKPNPILGVGFNSVVAEMKKWPHNMYLILMAELGIFAIPFFGILGHIAVKSRAYYVLPIFFIFIFDIYLFQGDWNTFLVTGILFGSMFGLQRFVPRNE